MPAEIWNDHAMRLGEVIDEGLEHLAGPPSSFRFATPTAVSLGTHRICMATASPDVDTTGQMYCLHGMPEKDPSRMFTVAVPRRLHRNEMVDRYGVVGTTFLLAYTPWGRVDHRVVSAFPYDQLRTLRSVRALVGLMFIDARVRRKPDPTVTRTT